jgi:hypothetical protein
LRWHQIFTPWPDPAQPRFRQVCTRIDVPLLLSRLSRLWFALPKKTSRTFIPTWCSSQADPTAHGRSSERSTTSASSQRSATTPRSHPTAPPGYNAGTRAGAAEQDLPGDCDQSMTANSDHSHEHGPRCFTTSSTTPTDDRLRTGCAAPSEAATAEPVILIAFSTGRSPEPARDRSDGRTLTRVGISSEHGPRRPGSGNDDRKHLSQAPVFVRGSFTGAGRAASAAPGSHVE